MRPQRTEIGERGLKRQDLCRKIGNGPETCGPDCVLEQEEAEQDAEKRRTVCVVLLYPVGLASCVLEAVVCSTFPLYSGQPDPVVAGADGGDSDAQA